MATEPVTESPKAVASFAASRGWYAIAQKEDNEAEIRIYEDIGLFGVSAKQFADDLEQISADRIHVRLNTYGGEAFDGIAIHNSLKAHPAEVVIHVDGIAASAGSIIAMAGDEIRMANNAFLMIHEASGGVFGEAGDMRDYADMLDKLNDSIATTYQARAGKTRKYWRDRMAEESWFSADEAKGEGLSDAIDEPVKTAKNRFDFKIYNRAPDAARNAWARKQEEQQAPPEGVAEPQQTQAPENSTCVEPPPATQKEKSDMPDESTTTNPPAQIPAAAPNGNPQGDDLKSLNAQAVEKYRNEGRIEGAREERAAQIARIDAIVDACPGKPEMALAALKSGQSPESVKNAYDAVKVAENEAQKRINELTAENLRQQQLIALGGHGGVSFNLSDGAEASDGVPPKVRAEKEWDRNVGVDGKPVRNQFSTKERYVAYRTAELKGQVRRQVAGATA